jgi:WD40 repeat protein
VGDDGFLIKTDPNYGISSWSFNVDTRTDAISTSNRLIATASLDHSVRVWDPRVPEKVFTLARSPEAGCPRALYSIQMDDVKIISAGCDGIAVIWEMRTRIPLQVVRPITGGKRASIYSLKFDENLLVIGTFGFGCTLCEFNKGIPYDAYHVF